MSFIFSIFTLPKPQNIIWTNLGRGSLYILAFTYDCLLTDREKMSNHYRETSIDASYQVSVHLAKRFYRRFFRNQPIRNKNCQWWPCLLMDRYEMSNHNRRLSIDASYQVSVHLTERFQMRRI